MKLEGRLPEVRIEIVTTTFVASGQPEGIHDLGRFLENLNNAAISRQIELKAPAIRPLYRAQAHIELDAPLLIRREEIVFANFDGPYFTRGTVQPTRVDVPVLLMSPPFQIQGMVALAPGVEATQALRNAIASFFVVRNALVFDAEGNQLGEGEQIIVNGGAVQMSCATRRHIEAVAPVAHTQSQTIARQPDAQEVEERARRAA
ncbi:MAG TPA: hypothetical protein VEZ14_09565 [Dehalococcoidia bacterium]|nr:hypothetical protein [Dehalococcoidia bacterium]